MKKIGFCIDSLKMGGAEKLLVDIIKALYKTKEYKIYLLIKVKSNSCFYNEIKDYINYYYLLTFEENGHFKSNKNMLNNLKCSILKNKRFKGFSNNVDILTDFLDGDFYKYIRKEKNKTKIVWLHSNYKDLVIRKKVDKKINTYDKVIVVTEGMHEELKNKELFMI